MSLPFATYSFSELVGTLVAPNGTTYTCAGQKGLNSISYERLTTTVTQQKTADGFVNQSFELGANTRASIEIAQTSDLDDFLLAWFNAVYASITLGDSALANAGVMNFRHVVTGRTHTSLGVAIEKIPNQAYGGQGAMRVWPLLICEQIDQ